MINYELVKDKAEIEKLCEMCMLFGKDHIVDDDDFYRITFSTFNGKIGESFGHKKCVLEQFDNIKNEEIATCVRCGFTYYKNAFYTINDKGDRVCDACYCE